MIALFFVWLILLIYSHLSLYVLRCFFLNSPYIIIFMIAERSDKTRDFRSRYHISDRCMYDGQLLTDNNVAKELIVFRIMSLPILALATIRPVSPNNTERDRYKGNRMINNSHDCGNSRLLSITCQNVFIGSIRVLQTSPRRVFASSR